MVTLERIYYPQPTPFVGRIHERAEVETLLAKPDCRLLTLVGPGGVGKTRLALAVMEYLLGSDDVGAHGRAPLPDFPLFPDGVYFVTLQPLNESSQIVSALVEALRLTTYDRHDPRTVLVDFLRDKQLLLILDNCEHLLDGVALVGDLLADAPGVKVLATSREALNLQEEWRYPVKGLSFPLSELTPEVEDYEAVQLFLHNARRAQPDFDLLIERPHVIRLCRMAEGMPLALEMAASWVKALSCAQIVDEMRRSLDILATTTRNVPERHRSMRAVFNHSLNLLSDEESRVFEKLSVFRGGFERAAAEQVAGASLPILASLVEKSLVRKLPLGRYDIHELLRQYGEEHLEASGTRDAAHDAHSRYYGDFLQRREADLKGRRQVGVLPEIEADFENVRTAWNWALKQQPIETLHTMLESLLWFGLIRSRQHDVNALFQLALTQVTGDGSAFVKARIVARQCYLLPHETPPHLTVERLDQSLAIVERHGDAGEISICKVLFALLLGGAEQRDFQRALTCAGDSFTYFENVGDAYYQAYALHAFALAYYYQGERQQALQVIDECAQLRRVIGDRYGTARILLLVAAEAYSIPDYDKAERFNREVRDIWRELKSWNYVSFVNVNLAYLAIFRGDFETAKALLDEALALAKAVNIGDHIAYALALFAVLASLEERYTEAWQLLSEAKQLAIHTSAIEALEWALPLAACGLGDYETAKQANARAFKYASRLRAPARILWHLPAASLILAHEGSLERAAEILGLIYSHPASAQAWLEKWPLLTRLRDSLEAALGADAYHAAWERGKTLDPEKVAAKLIAEFQQNHEPQVHQPLTDPLTSRELEVLQLLAEGLSNHAIAERLVIGAGTTKTHTLNIYRKLDVRSRTQAVIRARELRLVP